MHLATRLLRLLAVATAASAFAQTITVPNAPPLVEHVLPKYGVAIKVPKSWCQVAVARNEILVRNGLVDRVNSTCMIRLTSVAELGSTSPQAFVDAMSKERFLDMTAISGSKPEVHVFDTALLAGIPARRIIHMQPFKGVPLTYLSYQALRGADIFTVTCYAKQSDFANVMSTFGMIIGTTRFLR